MSRLTVAFAATTLAGLLAGCTTILPGTPKPEPGPSGEDAPAAGGSCARSTSPEQCVEWRNTQPKTGEQLIAQAKQDALITAQMLCSAVPAQVWDRYLGAGHYRLIDEGRACTISSDDTAKTPDGKLAAITEIQIYLSPTESIARDLQILRSRKDTAGMVTELSLAGKPAMRVGREDDADGKGPEKEELSVAVLGDVTQSGTLRIRQSMRPPRGQPAEAPVDRSTLDAMRDAVIGEFLTVLFP
ncbi:hypothetical protein [Lentzea jiangxiensis]|uniref:PknH-like extracellular domain-containing protein n=1 Tax=Lentzea jiangxiensis TaxID=641025 RepID=A0A1H0X4Q6_9PSEU|nr:hypothetical protein [Lentzea jiangxiensis]SDP97880.1 hypothetical protein SAMN05421507_13431 [Lentzea jiangxiensis]